MRLTRSADRLAQPSATVRRTVPRRTSAGSSRVSPLPARAPLRCPDRKPRREVTASADEAPGRGAVRRDPFSAASDHRAVNPTAHRATVMTRGPGRASGPAAAYRQVLRHCRRHPWTLRELLIGAGPGGRPSFSAAVDGHRSPSENSTTQRRRGPSFTSPARRVDHQVQPRRRSGDGCPPSPTAPRKSMTHTCISDTTGGPLRVGTAGAAGPRAAC